MLFKLKTAIPLMAIILLTASACTTNFSKDATPTDPENNDQKNVAARQNGNDSVIRMLTSFFNFLRNVDKPIENLLETENDRKQTQKLAMTEENDPEKLLHDDKFMEEAIKTYTLKSITEALRKTSHSKNINCHNRAHELGRMAYQVIGSDAFSQCGIACHSGCRHGATEAFFAHKGTANLKESVNLLCEKKLNAFNTHQCFHGIGHGLMAWSDYEIQDALDACDLIEHPSSRASCYTGIFMENIGGSIAIGENKNNESYHTTAYLNEDPHYPCNILDDKYKNECYFLQTDRMRQLLNNDPDSIGIECAKAPLRFQNSCFASMGRTISGMNGQNPKKSVETCKKIPVPSNAEACMHGSLRDHLWDETQADGAIDFCQITQNTSFERKCYDTIIRRAADVVSNMQAFCKKLPKQYGTQCLNQKPSTAPQTPKNEKQNPQPPTTLEKTANPIIKYSNGQYVPKKIHVSKGQKITWINQDQAFWPASNIHPTHAAYPNSDIKKCGTAAERHAFDACTAIGRNETFSFVFNEPGTWRYHDHLNPQATGIVYVSEN